MVRGKKVPSPTQANTLRHYFSPGNTKKSSKSSSSSTTPRAQVRATKVPATKVTHNEIIVIDSSDDELLEVSRPIPRKKRKLSTSSSDEVEIVAFSRGRTKDDQMKVDERDHKPGPSKIATFGKPSSLLRTKSTPTPSHGVFGQPNHLLGASKSSSFGPQSSVYDVVDNSMGPSDSGTSLCPSVDLLVNDADCDIDLSNLPEDEWGLGDDERIGGLSLDDEENTEDTSLFDDLGSTSDATLSSEGDEAKPSPNLKPLTSLSIPYGPQPLRSCDGKTKSSSNAFSVLMSSNKDKEAWKEATKAEDPNFRPSKNNGGRRKAPFYKVMPGMPIAVDAFRYGTIPGVTAYFLTHAHSDHYTNLSSTWNSGPIYCSEGTANLIMHILSVDPKWVHPLPMDAPTVIPYTGGVTVTLIEANHCPGSCLFFFEGQQTVHAGDSTYKSPYIGTKRVFRYLHCGDFRASPQHVLHPAVKGKRIDQVYLDTTYLDPKYTFPPQPLVISACAEFARRMASGESCQGNGRTVDSWLQSPTSESGKGKQSDDILFVVGTYSIGKERIVKAIAHALKTKVYCDKRKTAILRCQSDPELDALLTSNPYEARVHLVPLGLVTSDRLTGYVERYKANFSKAVGFRPTGWTYSQPAGTDLSPTISQIISRAQQRSFTYADLRPSRGSTPNLCLIPVPYSEHSSFFELTCFAMSIDWVKMIATVNVGTESSRAKMAKWVQKWEAERRKSKGKGEIVPYRKEDYW